MSVFDRAALEASPLADLHAIASELTMDGYRRLRKADLIDAIIARQEGEEPGGRDGVGRCGGLRSGRRRGGGARRGDGDPGAPTAGAARWRGLAADASDETAERAPPTDRRGHRGAGGRRGRHATRRETPARRRMEAARSRRVGPPWRPMTRRRRARPRRDNPGTRLPRRNGRPRRRIVTSLSKASSSCFRTARASSASRPPIRRTATSTSRPLRPSAASSSAATSSAVPAVRRSGPSGSRPSSGSIRSTASRPPISPTAAASTISRRHSRPSGSASVPRIRRARRSSG